MDKTLMKMALIQESIKNVDFEGSRVEKVKADVDEQMKLFK